MKRKLSIILALLMTLSIVGCSKINTVKTANEIEKPSWNSVSNSQLSPPYTCYVSGFLNKDMGIVVGTTIGHVGMINVTADGGKKWEKGINPAMSLHGIDVLNDKIAFACGNNSFVIKTADGGKSWVKLSSFGESEPNQPRFLSFTDEKTGWIATPSKFTLGNNSIALGSTTDGGKTWIGVNLPSDVTNIAAIYLRTPNDGYVLDASGNLYITDDAGKSFKKHTLNITDANLFVSDAATAAFTFTDEKNVILAYDGTKDSKIQVIKSSDGGTTWTKESIPDVINGSLYLTRDGKFLTATLADGSIKVLEHK